VGVIAFAVAIAALGFCAFAVGHRWIAAPSRVAALAVVAAGMIVAGARLKLTGRPIASAIGLVAGLVALYVAAHVAGPGYDGLIAPAAMWVALSAVTLLGGVVAAAVRSLPAAVVATVGGYLTPVVLQMSPHEPAVWMIYLLAVTGGALGLAASRRWISVSALALAGTLVFMTLWLHAFYASDVAVAVMGYSWCLVGLFAVYAVAADAGGAVYRPVAMFIVGVIASALVALSVAISNDVPDYAIGAQWLALDASVLGLCLWRHWRALRAAALTWTVAAVACLWWRQDPSVPLRLGWVGAFYVLFMLDSVLWAVWGRLRTADAVGGVIAALATAVMVATAWPLATVLLGPWVAGCAAGVGIVLVAIGLLLRVAPTRPVAAVVYLLAGLACLVIATPLQVEGREAIVGCAVAAAGLLVAAVLIRTHPLRYAAWGLLAAVALNVGWSHLTPLTLPWRVGACSLLAAAVLICCACVKRFRVTTR
jgi:hypothetical protein